MKKTCRSMISRLFQTCFYGVAFMIAPGVGAANPDYQVSSSFAFSEQYREADTWFPSEEFSYNVEIVNSGTETAGAAEVQVSIPEDFVITGYGWGQLPTLELSGASYNHGSRIVSFTSAPPSTGLYLNFRGSIAAAGNYPFETTLQSATDANPANNAANQAVSIIQKPAIDLVTTMTVLQPVVNWGETSHMVVEFANHGPSPAYDVLVKSTAGGLEDAVSTCTHGVAEFGAAYRIPVLNPGETGLLQISGRSSMPGDKEEMAEIYNLTYGYIEANPLDNYSYASYTVYYDIPEFDLVGRLDASTTAIQPGGLLTLSMGITNLGPDTATSLTLTSMLGNFLPYRVSDLQLLAIEDAGAWEVSIIDQLGLLNGFLATLPADESATISIVCRVLPTAVGNNGQIAQHFGFTSFWKETEPVPTNQNAYVVVDLMEPTETSLTDLRINQTADRDTASLHQPITYTITGMNQGPTLTATGYLNALIPASMQISSVTSNHGNPMVVGNYVSLSNLALGVNETATLQVEVVPLAVGAAAVQVGTVSSNYDPAIGNNLGEIVTQVVENPDCSNYQVSLKSSKLKSKKNKKTGTWKTNGKVQVEVQNTGKSCTPATAVNVYQSSDAVLDPTDIPVYTGAVKAICPDAKKASKVNLQVKMESLADPAGKFYLVVIDEQNAVAECDEADNLLAVQ